MRGRDARAGLTVSPAMGIGASRSSWSAVDTREFSKAFGEPPSAVLYSSTGATVVIARRRGQVHSTSSIANAVGSGRPLLRHHFPEKDVARFSLKAANAS
jgi:hypothetical protein